MKDKNDSALARMLKYVWQEDKKIYFICMLYTIVAIAVPVISVALPKFIIGYLTEGEPSVSGIVRLVLLFFIFGASVYFLKEWLLDFAYPRITSLRIDYIKEQAVKLLTMDYKYMEQAEFFNSREKAFEATSSNNNGVEGIYHKLFDLPQLVLIVIALSVFIGIKSVWILLALLVHIFITSYIAILVQKYQYKRKEELSKKERRVEYYSTASKDFAFGKDIRVYDLKSRILSNFKKEISGYIDIFKVIKNKEYLLGFLSLFTLIIADIVSYGMLTYLTVKGMSIADYSMYIAASITLTVQMTALSENITYIMQEYMYVKDLYKFFDEDLGEKGGELKAVGEDVPLDIEFIDVNFTYPGTDKPIFRNFSLYIPAGSKLALVGINGAGKTTFVKLLTGMFKADSGKILINGHDVNEYDKQELFSMFCVVFQEVNILALTVAQNIACAVDDIDYAKVDEVLKQVDLYDKVHSLEKGVNSMMLKVIEEDGVIFSGGENQRLTIARALYKGGSCVIMDEPTASLDALAEASIYSQFDTLIHNRTAIYISHRLASTKFCDAIALIDNDGLREYGTHDELMALGGAYHDMFVVQGKYYQTQEEEI